MKIDIVLQGPIHPFTKEIVEHYLNLKFVSNIIVSCWENDHTDFDSYTRVRVIKSSYSVITAKGCGNVNYQIQTSKAGINASDADIIVKIRTDQQFHLEDMEAMRCTFLTKRECTRPFSDGKFPRGKIFCAGMFPSFAYHMRDHIFWGFKEDMVRLFNIPFSTQDNLYPDFNASIRAETYLGAHYFSLFNSSIKNQIENYKDYLTDNSPKRLDAMTFHYFLRDEIFGVFPRLRLIWKKYGVHDYTLLGAPEFGEYWGEWHYEDGT